MKAGRKELDVFGGVRQIYGYQALGALLREGKYDTEFLTSVGRDMIAMDRKDPRAWEFHTPYGLESVLNQGKEGGRGFYPLTGLMEALGNNPDAATAFFNEPVREDTDKDGIVTKDDKPVKGQHGQDRGMVDYMLDKKPYMDSFDITRTGDLHPAQQALGDALVAAVSHRSPGDEDAPPVAHTKEMAAVMERVVERIGDKPELVVAKPGDPEGPLHGLSGHFGQMAAEYMPDIQAAAGNDSRMIKANGEMAEFGKSGMASFIGAVGQDPDAYGAMTTAQRTFTTALVNDVFAHRSEHDDLDAAIKVAVHPGGQIAGILSEARAEGIFAENGHKKEEYVKGVEDNAKWVNRVISAAGGKYLEMVPLAGMSWGRFRRTSRRARSRAPRRRSSRRSRAATSRRGSTTRNRSGSRARPRRPRCASRRKERACPNAPSTLSPVWRPPRRRMPIPSAATWSPRRTAAPECSASPPRARCSLSLPVQLC
ncbi:DUF6571 family protein [Streptomyces sp. MS1.HAVA.3]|uniref:DUF6571 family protein n=1 Tax=Streptomyces caledonius TaxID=3134107 RepID=A0ABU8U8A0_9ACTN